MDEEQVNKSSLNCLDENGNWRQPANEVVKEITETECENIQANIGIDGTDTDNNASLQSLVCLIKQEVDALAGAGATVVAPNDESKCTNDELPTLASMWSRILRWSQAVTCVLCAYNPYIATLLKQGRYPQILMGAVQEGGYPTWVEPDAYPTDGSGRPVTSDGVIKAIHDAMMGVWHPYIEYPSFSYFAQTLNSADDLANLNSQTGMENGDTALVANDGTRTSAVYTWNGSAWIFTKQLTEADDNLTNFAVTNILKGYYATKDVYYFASDNPTWNVMDADLTELEKRVEELEKIFQKSVLGRDNGEEYVLTTRANLTDANSVACSNGKQTIVLITG